VSRFGLFCANFWRRVGLVTRACLKKEGLAFVALMVSLSGAGILSLMLWGNLVYFRSKGATEPLFYLSCGMLLLIGIVFMSSHRLLGSKQAIEAELWQLKFKLNQGEDPTSADPGAQA
jgi:hypothetical protein